MTSDEVLINAISNQSFSFSGLSFIYSFVKQPDLESRYGSGGPAPTHLSSCERSRWLGFADLPSRANAGLAIPLKLAFGRQVV